MTVKKAELVVWTLFTLVFVWWLVLMITVV